MWNRTKTAFGYALLVLGAIGVVLPIIPGIPFLIAAVAVLGSDHPLIRRWKQRVNRRMKKDPISRR